MHIFNEYNYRVKTFFVKQLSFLQMNPEMVNMGDLHNLSKEIQSMKSVMKQHSCAITF